MINNLKWNYEILFLLFFFLSFLPSFSSVPLSLHPAPQFLSLSFSLLLTGSHSVTQAGVQWYNLGSLQPLPP